MLPDTPAPLYLFVGRTASGKETQSKMLANALDCSVFMTGAKFRSIIRSKSPLGERIRADYESGKLMPDWVADFMFQNFVFKLPHGASAVFEGSGRSIEQANMIDAVCQWLGRPYTVFNLEVSEDEVVRRSLARGRDDGLDRDESVIRARLAEFGATTRPAIDRFKELGHLVQINGEQPPASVHTDVMKHVKR